MDKDKNVVLDKLRKDYSFQKLKERFNIISLVKSPILFLFTLIGFVFLD
jgi:hypothetical protein